MSAAWAAGNNACYCDPISSVKDCDETICQGYLVAVLVLFGLCLVWVVWELIRFIKNPTARKGTRAKIFLLGLLFTVCILHTLRYALLLGKVGENDYGAEIALNIFLIVGSSCILSSLSVVLYMWRKVHAISTRVHTRFRLEKALLWIFNVVLYTMLILLNVLEMSTGNSAYGIAFNIISGILIVVLIIVFLAVGLRLYKAAIKSGMVAGDALVALRKMTLLTLISTLAGVVYIIVIIIFLTLRSRGLTSDLVTRHLLYRIAEAFAFSALLLTFRHSSRSGSDNRSMSTVARSGDVPMESESTQM